MKIKDLIEELSKLPEDLEILHFEDDDWEWKATTNHIDYRYLYYDYVRSSVIIYIKNDD